MSALESKGGQKKLFERKHRGGLQRHFQCELAHMEMPFPSRDPDPSLSLVEPLISSLLLCSARLGGLEFKWGSLTSFSYLQLHLGKHSQMHTHAHATRSQQVGQGAQEDGITVLCRVSFNGNSLYFIALLAHNNAFLEKYALRPVGSQQSGGFDFARTRCQRGNCHRLACLQMDAIRLLLAKPRLLSLNKHTAGGKERERDAHAAVQDICFDYLVRNGNT